MKKRLLSTAVALAALGAVGGALANAVTPFDLTVPISLGGGPITYSNLTAIDWNENGSGIAIGVGPFSTGVLPVGAEFQFLYQANAVSLTGLGTPVLMDTNSNGVWDTGEINKQWELTVAVSLWEVVTDSGTNATGTFATFKPSATKTSTVSIFYDAANLANNTSIVGGGIAADTAAGTGFDGGIEIARFTVTPGIPGFETITTFTATANDAGQGSPKVYAELAAMADFVDSNFLVGILGSIFDWEWQGNINYPPSTSTTAGAHIGGDETRFPGHSFVSCGTPPCDITFKVDGSSQFTYQTPEPTTMLLFGAGLVGMGWMGRRRSRV